MEVGMEWELELKPEPRVEGKVETYFRSIQKVLFGFRSGSVPSMENKIQLLGSGCGETTD